MKARVIASFAASLALLGNCSVSAADADLIKQGEYLARAGDCVACHTAKAASRSPAACRWRPPSA